MTVVTLQNNSIGGWVNVRVDCKPYWRDIITLISGGIIVWCKDLSKKIKERKAEQEALKSGLLAILHDRLFSICNQYLAMDYIPVDKSEEILDNAKIIYDAYHGLGGNGTGTAIYEKFMKLQVRKGEKTNGSPNQ